MASSKYIQIVPTLQTSPDYADGDLMGAVVVLTDFFAGSKLQTLVSGHVRDLANVGPSFKLMFFKAVPSGGTYTDNSAVVLSAADWTNHIGTLSIASGSFGTVSSTKVQSLLNQQYKLGAGIDSLWVLCVAGGAYNVVGASDLVIDLAFESTN